MGVDVTGMLLYLDPFFLQVLEGEETVVDMLFNFIKQDSRHHKISVIYKKPIAKRSFLDWTMGFNRINDKDVAMLEGFNDFWHRPISYFSGDAPNEIEKLLDKFKHEMLF